MKAVTNNKFALTRIAKTGLTALAGLAGLLMLSPAHAQVQYQLIGCGTLDFNTTNQSLWAPGDALAATYNYGVNQSWNTGNQGSSSYSAGFGGEADASSSGTAGLNLSASATSGSANVDYQCLLALAAPSTLKAGQPFLVQIIYNYQGSITTQSPQFNVSVDAMINGSASATVKAEAFSATVFNESPSVGMDVDENLLQLNNQSIAGNIDIKGLGILTGSGHVPMINTSSQPNFDSPITSTGTDNFLTVDGDITKLLTTLLGWGSFKNSQDYTVTKAGTNWFEADWGYNFLDLYGELDLDAEQDFSFTATPMVTLTFYWGGNHQQSVSFPAGTTTQVTLPASAKGTISVTGTVDISNNNTFTSNTSLIVNPGLYFLPVSANIDASVAVFGTLFNKTFEPIQPIDLVSAAYPIPVYTRSFALQGFKPQNLPEFKMTAN